jgi:hypothetical protein
MENTYFWDVETHVEDEEAYMDEEEIEYDEKVEGFHEIYSIGVVKATKRRQNETDEEYGRYHFNSTIIFYGLDAQQRFAMYLITIHEDLQGKVDRAFNSSKTKFLNKKRDYLKRLQEGYDASKDPIIRNELKRQIEKHTTYNENLEEYYKPLIEAKKRKYVRKFQVRFYGYNSSKFDNMFLWKVKELRYKEVIDSNGLAYIELFEGLVVFLDVMRMTGTGKLEQLCKDMALPDMYQKSEFPHFFASRNTLHYKGPVPEGKYWPTGEVPTHLQGKQDWCFASSSMYYLKIDVVATLLCWDKFSRSLYNAIGFTTTDFITAPSLAYHYVLENTIPGQIHLITDNAIDDWIRKAIFGGRCFLQISHISKKLGDEEHMLLDITSLYPKAMRDFEYPIGQPYWEQDLEAIRNQLNSLTLENLAIIECLIDFPNKKIVMPLIPTRKADGTHESTLYDGQYHIISSIDLMEAIKYNDAVVREVYKVLVWPMKAKVFEKAIDTLWGIRKKAKAEKNKSMDAGAKVMLNSSYGKTIQKKVDSKLVVMDNASMIDKLYLEGRVVGDYTLPNGEQCLIERKLANCEKAIKYPAHLGVFILAYSKKHVNKYIEAFNGFKDWDNASPYGDTDSLLIRKSLLKYIPKEWLGNDLGQAHDDFGGDVTEYVGVRLKCYYMEGEDDEENLITKKTSKGISKSVISSITKDDYLSMIYENVVVERSYTEFKRDFKHENKPAITNLTRTKKINQEPWTGRRYDPSTKRWYPWGSTF